MEMDALVALLLSGTTGAAIIKLIDGVIQFRLQRKAKQEDKKEENDDKIRDDLNSLKGCMMIIMFEHIREFCEHHMEIGYMDIDARRRLSKMHERYKGVDGNGDGDRLVTEAYELPFYPPDNHHNTDDHHHHYK